MRHARGRLRRADRGHGRDQPEYAPRIRVAVVTGGSSGIGAALARRLAADGWRLVLVARGRDRLEPLAAELGAEAEACDVSDRSAVEALARRVAGRHDAVHLLCLSAGIPGRGGGFLDLSAERIEALTAINYLGSVWCLRAFLPLLERGAPSDVVTVASVAGTTIPVVSGPYAASKHAQLAFARSSAAELAPRRIRMHAVNPGPVPTPGFPQERTLASRLGRHLVVSSEHVAERILGAIERDRREIVVPRAFRLAAVAQAAAPGLLGRLAPHLRRFR